MVCKYRLYDYFALFINDDFLNFFQLHHFK